jgi:hypothetical protein
MILFWSAMAMAAPSASALKTAFLRDAAARQRLGHLRLQLGEADWATLAGAGVVRQVVHRDGADMAVGAIWTAASQAAAWISTFDGWHRSLSGDATNTTKLPGCTDMRRLVHTHLDLPWPMSDRQWVVDNRPNTALWSATEGRVWERAWEVAPATLATAPVAGALWVDTNQGAWQFIEAEGGTLVLFGVRSSMGGVIPDSLTVQWSRQTLGEALRRLDDFATTMAAHYVGAHEVIWGPMGAPIAPGSLGAVR